MPILRRFLCLPLLAALAHAQSPAATPTFLIADIHPSPHHTQPFFYAPPMVQNRYVLHDATMVDLVTTAYGLLQSDNVHGGPSWLELDRYDLIAKVPPNTSREQLRIMLRALLADRFHLVVQPGTAPLPAYVLSVAKSGPKLKESEGKDLPDCRVKDRGPTDLYLQISCHHMTMEAFADQIHNMASGYLKQPVVNSTALDGTWDFDLKWSGRGQLEKQGPDGISVFDAVEKQLGLKLDLQTSPRPVIEVASVDEKPTPNAPNLDKILPPQPHAVFDVATLKPSKPSFGWHPAEPPQTLCSILVQYPATDRRKTPP